MGPAGAERPAGPLRPGPDPGGFRAVLPLVFLDGPGGAYLYSARLLGLVV